MTYLVQFFAYIPILGPVLSFGTRKLHKWLNSKIVDFCVEIDQKSKFLSQTCVAQFFSRLGNHQFDPLLWNIRNFQNSSSWNQNLRFIHLGWVPSRLSFRLHQGFLFKEQMNFHKCVLNLKLHWVTSSTYHSCLVPTSLPPTILI